MNIILSNIISWRNIKIKYILMYAWYWPEILIKLLLTQYSTKQTFKITKHLKLSCFNTVPAKNTEKIAGVELENWWKPILLSLQDYLLGGITVYLGRNILRSHYSDIHIRQCLKMRLLRNPTRRPQAKATWHIGWSIFPW